MQEFTQVMLTVPLPQALKILTAPIVHRSSMRTGLCLWKGRAICGFRLFAAVLLVAKGLSKADREEESKLP
jgi:hypothetical protein